MKRLKQVWYSWGMLVDVYVGFIVCRIVAHSSEDVISKSLLLVILIGIFVKEVLDDLLKVLEAET